MTLGNDNGTDGQTDRQTEFDAIYPPREEGRIISVSVSVSVSVSDDSLNVTFGWSCLYLMPVSARSFVYLSVQ